MVRKKLCGLNGSGQLCQAPGHALTWADTSCQLSPKLSECRNLVQLGHCLPCRGKLAEALQCGQEEGTIVKLLLPF